MVNIEYINVTPSKNINAQSFVDEYGEDVFTLVEQVFWGDLIISTEEHSFRIDGIKILKFSSDMFWSAFLINFRGQDERQVISFWNDNSKVVISKNGDGVTVSFYIAGDRSIYFNGHEYSSGESMRFEFRLSTFNEMCGAMLESNIRLLEERFGEIDGIREYFESIPFAEGYEDKF